jgi:hypothetical protein
VLAALVDTDRRRRIMDSLPPAFFLLLPYLPLVIVYVVGIVISSTNLRRHRRAAALGMAGFGGLLLGQLIRVSATVMTLPAYRGSTPIHELSTRLTLINIVGTLAIVAGTIVLLLAIFAGRDKKY